MKQKEKERRNRTRLLLEGQAGDLLGGGAVDLGVELIELLAVLGDVALGLVVDEGAEVGREGVAGGVLGHGDEDLGGNENSGPSRNQ